MDGWLDTISEPFLAPFQGHERVYWLYLLTAVLLALGVFLKRSGGLSLRGFLRFLLPREVYAHPSTRVDLAYFAVNTVLFGLVFGSSLLSAQVVQQTVGAGLDGWLPAHVLPVSGWGVTLAVTVATVLAADLGLFVTHYLQHRVPLLWEFHRVHHSAQVLTPLSTYRMHPVDDLLTISGATIGVGVTQGLALHLLPAGPEQLHVLGLNALTFGFYVLGYNLRHSHVWLSFGPLERVLVSPAMHQIHHSREPRHFDRNMGFMFSWWDALAGTRYIPAEREDLAFGLGDDTDEAEFSSVARLYLRPFRTAWARWKDMLVMGRGTKLLAIATIALVLGLQLRSLERSSAAPDAASVHLADLTWPEVRRHIEAGGTTVIVPTGGTEQNGPHMVLGKHHTVVRHTAERVAEELGGALVAPVIDYVPEGDSSERSGHMAFPGTLSVPEPVFAQVLEHTARSLRTHGFTRICFLGDSGGNQAAQADVARRLSAEWSEDGVEVIHAGDYYADNGQTAWLRERGEPREAIGKHAGIRDTSELLALDPSGVRASRRAPDGGASPGETGCDGDPTRASAERGRALLELKVEAAVRQIRAAPDRDAEPLARAAGGSPD